MNTSMVASPSIPDLLKRIIDLVKRTASRNVILGLIAVLPGLLIVLAGWLATPSTGMVSSELTEQAKTAIFWGRVLMGGGFIVFLTSVLWCTLGGIYIAEREDAKAKLSVVQALRHAGRRFWSALTFSVIEIFIIGLYMAFAVFVTALLGMPALVLSEGGQGAEVLNTLFAILIGSVVVIPVVYLLVAWSLGFNAIVIDGSGPVDAFSRSAALVKGAWWKILLISALATLAYQLPSFAVTELLALSGVFSSSVQPALEIPTASEFDFSGLIFGAANEIMISWGITFILAILIEPVYSTVLYLARRSQKDVELSPVEEAKQPGSFNQEIV